MQYTVPYTVSHQYQELQAPVTQSSPVCCLPSFPLPKDRGSIVTLGGATGVGEVLYHRLHLPSCPQRVLGKNTNPTTEHGMAWLAQENDVADRGLPPRAFVDRVVVT